MIYYSIPWLICGWFVWWIEIRNDDSLTLLDFLMFFVASLLGPGALTIWLFVRSDDIVIWRRKK